MQLATAMSRLRESGILNEKELEEVERLERESHSYSEIESNLLERNIITPFQVKALSSDEQTKLVYGKYRLLDHLGRGGFGNVFKAVHSLMQREVALKVVLPELVEEPRARSWFRREVLAATQLTHQNIVLAFDADEDDDELYFVMEFVDGPTLDALVKTLGPLPLPFAWEMMRQAASALEHASKKRMVHRDIKPSNCLIPHPVLELLTQHPNAVRLDRECLLKITDFGLARIQQLSGNSTSLTETRKGFLGTPDYVAPEQAQNARDADIRSDLYSLGCTFYFALTGRKPFKCENAVETILKHLQEEAEPLEVWRPELKPEEGDLIRRLMAKRPEDRFQTPREFIEAVETIQNPTVIHRTGFDSHSPDSSQNTAATRVPSLSSRKMSSVSPGSVPVIPKGWVNTSKRAATSQAGASKTHQGWTKPPAVLPARDSDHSHRSDHSSDSQKDDSRIDEKSPTPVAAGPSAVAAGPSIVEKPRTADSEAFRQSWRKWFTALEAVVKGGRVPYSANEYQKVYSSLVEHLHQLGETGSSEDSSRFRWLESMVEPWVNVQSLAMADEKDLDSIWEACHSVNEDLGIENVAGEIASNWSMVLLAAILIGLMFVVCYVF